MCRVLSPIVHSSMKEQHWESANACFRAGEYYECMLDLLWVAIAINSPRDTVMDAFSLVLDEDKEQFRQPLKEHAYA